MSTIKVYSVFDSKAEAFMQPFFATAKGLAIRMMENSVKDPKSVMNAHPEDFTLFEIGDFCDASGSIIGYDVIIPVIKAIELLGSDV